MRLKLKENPREWQKFTAVMAVLFAALSFLAYRRAWIQKEGFVLIAALLIGAVILSILFPRSFRPLYRCGMTLSFHISQIMGTILLTIFFLIVLTPIALLLRLTGKDLLALKPDPNATTFWQPAKPSNDFNRMF
jgi:hypothetical protein